MPLLAPLPPSLQWLINYLVGLKGVTSVVVSHDSGFLDAVCSSIIHYEDNFKLKKYLVSREGGWVALPHSMHLAAERQRCVVPAHACMPLQLWLMLRRTAHGRRAHHTPLPATPPPSAGQPVQVCAAAP